MPTQPNSQSVALHRAGRLGLLLSESIPLSEKHVDSLSNVRLKLLDRLLRESVRDNLLRERVSLGAAGRQLAEQLTLRLRVC